MAGIKLAPNLAMKVTAVTYIDLVPSTQGYDSQVRIKGTFDGEKGVLYSPGKIVDALNTLHAAGIIGVIPDNLEPEKPVDLKPKKKEFELILDQPAGQKYGTLRVVGAVATVRGAEANSPAVAPPVVNGKKLTGIYKDATEFFLEKILPIYKHHGIELLPGDMVAGVATLFIAKSKES